MSISAATGFPALVMITFPSPADNQGRSTESALTRRLGRVAQQTGARAESLVRDAVKGHLDYLEWLGGSLDEAEQEAGRENWLSTAQIRSALAAEIGGPWPNQGALTGRRAHYAI